MDQPRKDQKKHDLEEMLGVYLLPLNNCRTHHREGLIVKGSQQFALSRQAPFEGDGSRMMEQTFMQLLLGIQSGLDPGPAMEPMQQTHQDQASTEQYNRTESLLRGR